MFSVDYIHKSQDVSNRNLTNSKTRRLLREAYAIPYSVSPCEFLCWALSEPLFEISMGFMLLFLIAEVRYGKSTDYYARHIGRFPAGQK